MEVQRRNNKSDAKKFSSCKKMVYRLPVYHDAKFDGARTSPSAGGVI